MRRFVTSARQNPLPSPTKISDPTGTETSPEFPKPTPARTEIIIGSYAQVKSQVCQESKEGQFLEILINWSEIRKMDVITFSAIVVVILLFFVLVVVITIQGTCNRSST
ncbi:hypothetical protein KFK09_001164 [Dendrobium nobile]|uniref:Uncharacterized protein n=1 Tax=Dendrobium nobile TaxID=94219 RepID=A0A8T3CA25_DENNO|nr:hypothetical protein KFK09_001164 [Dendrobium nobile]